MSNAQYLQAVESLIKHLSTDIKEKRCTHKQVSDVGGYQLIFEDHSGILDLWGRTRVMGGVKLHLSDKVSTECSRTMGRHLAVGENKTFVDMTLCLQWHEDGPPEEEKTPVPQSRDNYNRDSEPSLSHERQRG